jgi:GNAT superfamily N-acetyltransferase
MINASTLLTLWEAGLNALPVDRMYLLLRAGYPEFSLEQLGRLTLGEKEVLLLRLREQLFGEALACVVDCHGCGQRLEFEFAAADIGALDYHPQHEPMAADGGLTVRALTLDDLRRANGSGRRLLASALGQVEEKPNLSVVETLGAEVIGRVSASLQALDPLMNIQLDLRCPGCQGSWLAPFEAITYVWTEIERWGARMLQTVNRLAAAYGWSELDILSMSAWRRQRYLEMVP